MTKTDNKMEKLEPPTLLVELKNADPQQPREDNKEGNYLQPFKFLFIRSVLHLLHALQTIATWPYSPMASLRLLTIASNFW